MKNFYILPVLFLLGLFLQPRLSGSFITGSGNSMILFDNHSSSRDTGLYNSVSGDFHLPGTLKGPMLDWLNLQWPPNASIAVGGNLTVYARCYEEGITVVPGEYAGISAWIGYSSSDSNPNTWTDWIPAVFNSQYDNNDEYMASFGASLGQGIYYYASRFSFNGGPYRYGGYNSAGGGLWDGIYTRSGVLYVGKTPAIVTIENILQQFNGSPRQVSCKTQPPGLGVQVTYNGSSELPVQPGNYTVVANISDPVYQGSSEATLSIYQVQQDAASLSMRNKFIWVMYDQVYNQSDLNTALSFKPDVIERSWFKWGNWGDFNWNDWSWMSNQAHQANSLFGGGGTVRALYADEVDPATFQRIVDRTPANKPMFFEGDTLSGYYFGDVQKTEFLDYLLSWIYKQVDAGANTIFLDGIAAVPVENTGYSDYSMGEFTLFLIRKFGEGRAWADDDKRWTSVLDINLDTDCTDGTIKTFNYRKYLQSNGYVSSPTTFSFPLGKEWGDPWNYTGTYLGEMNDKSCEYLYHSIKQYAEAHAREVYVTMNGFSNYVDYQTTGVWGNWQLSDGKLDISPSYISQWRSVKDYSLSHLNKDIPLLVFHDWGNGMPFLSEINEADQVLWLKVFTPEVFASGSVFSWPLSGGGVNYRSSPALLDTISRLESWYSENRELYINSQWNTKQGVNLKGQSKLVVTDLDEINPAGDTLKKIVHLINKNLSGDRKLVARNDFAIRVYSPKAPSSVWSVSPDFRDARKLNYTVSGDSVDITVSYLESYTVVVLDYAHKVPQTIHFNPLGNKEIGIADFDPGAWSSSGLAVSYQVDKPEVATIVGGKLHITGTGECTITASQAGNSQFEAAVPLTQTLKVSYPSGISNNKLPSLIMYPNPCTSVVTVQIPGNKISHIQVFDLLGQKWMDVMKSGNELDVHLLPGGVYLVRIDNSMGYLVKQ